MNACKSLRPPESTFHPIVALDTFLSSLRPIESTHVGQMTQNISVAPDGGERVQSRRKLILRVANTLFGSMLEGALCTLDSYSITEIVAMQSKRRFVVLVNAPTLRRGSSKQEEPGHHFCLVPDLMSGGQVGLQFCSCRSYFERNKVSMVKRYANAQPFAVCKHILALKLRPYLQDDNKITDTVTEEQFSQEVVKWLYEKKDTRA